MPDSRTRIGEPDRILATPNERFEIEMFASRHGISTEEARELIEQFGHDRDVLEREAARHRQH